MLDSSKEDDIKKVVGPQKARKVVRLRLHRMSVAKQDRMDELLTRNNNGDLTQAEREELRGLVSHAERISLNNARALQ